MNELKNKIEALKQKYNDNIENQYATTYEESEIAEVDNSVINEVLNYLDYINTMKQKAIVLKDVAEKFNYEHIRDDLLTISKSISDYEINHSDMPKEILKASKAAFDELAHDFDSCKATFFDSIDRAEKHYNSARTYKNKRDSYDTDSEEKSLYYYYNDLYHGQLTQGNADCSNAESYYEALINMFNSGLRKTSTVVAIDDSLEGEESKEIISVLGVSLTEVDLTDEERDLLYIPRDANVTIYKAMREISGISFPVYLVLDNDSDNSDRELALKQLLTYSKYSMEYVEKNVKNPKILEALSEKGYKLVYDETPNCDNCSYINDEGILQFFGAAWCAGWNETIKVHYYPYLDENLNVCNDWAKGWNDEALIHELGHAVDFSLDYTNPDNNYERYFTEGDFDDDSSYMTNGWDGFKRIYFDDLNGKYVLGNNDEKIYLNTDNSVQINGETYKIATIGEERGHYCELAAEVYRWHNVDPAHIIEACSKDDAYSVVTECILSRMEEDYGEDISWWRNFNQ